jgi:hypothetical protein
VAWALILELSTATAAEDKIRYSVECLQLILGILTMAMFCVSESFYSIFLRFALPGFPSSFFAGSG